MVMTKSRYSPIAALVLALSVAACGSSSKKTSTSGGGTSSGSMTVTESDFKLDPSTLNVDAAGSVTITVKNDGQTTHALEVEGQGTEKKTNDIAPGATATLTLDLKKGSYEMYCPIDGHKQLGMKGTVVVGGSSSGSSGGGSGSSTTSSNSDNGY
jgi:uncharacterized cupredoxin-like copper-binding protein